MYVFFKYVVVSWSPPHLTPDEEVSFGEEIAKLGKAHFRKNFRRNSLRAPGASQKNPSPSKPNGSPKWHGVLAIALSACVLLCTIIVAPVFSLSLVPIIGAVILMYFCSFGIALLRYDFWLTHCLRRFRKAPPAPPIHPLLLRTYDEIATSLKLLNTAEGIIPAEKTCSFEYNLTLSKDRSELVVKRFMAIVEIWQNRVHNICFAKSDDSEIEDAEVKELLLQNSDGATWGRIPEQPQYFFRSDDKAVASYMSERKSFFITGRDLLSTRVKASEEVKGIAPDVA